MFVYYDPVPDQIWVEGQPRSFARRSLLASIEGTEHVGIRMLPAATNDLLISTAFRNIKDRTGNGFASQTAAKAYLDGEFSKARQYNALMVTMTAGVALGGHRAVRGDPTGLATYASADALDDLDVVAGITASAAEAGAPFEVVAAGEMFEPSWAWDIGPVWLGLNGALTQTAPTHGIDQQIGVAIAPTRLIVDIAPSILLAQ